MQIQVASEVARDATTARELDDLLNRAVNLVRERFGFYHAGVFLLDEDRHYAVLTAATGKAGRTLLQRGHKLKVGGAGIVSFVAATGTPRMALDVETDTIHLRQPLLAETRSELALPLKVGERVIGILDVQSLAAHAFDEDDLQVLQTMADQLAIAIDNLRLLEEVQRRAEELEELYNTALVTTGELETEALLFRLYEQVQRLIAPDTFIVGLYDEKTQVVRIAFAMESGKPVESFLGLQLPIEKGGLSGWVIKNRQSLLLGDSEVDDLPADPVLSSEENPVTRAWLGVPLIVHDRVVGVVSIQSFQAEAFDKNHQRFLEAIAAQVAIALENARLFEAERSAREHAETLRELARVLSGNLELGPVLDSILVQLRRVLTFDTALILLLSEHGDALLVAGTGYRNETKTSSAASDLLRDSKILARMAQDLQSIIIPDVSEHPDWIWVPGAEHVKSFMGVPILIRKSMVGAFMVDSVKKDFFTLEDVHLVETLTQHVAIAIETARLFEVERAQLLLARTLQQAGMLLTSQLALDEVLERILDLLGRVVHYDSVSVQLLGQGKMPYLAASRGRLNFSQASQTVQDLRQYNLIEIGLEKREVIVIPDTNLDKRWKVMPETQYIRSWIGAPQLVRGELIGLLTVDSQTPSTYDHEIAETVMAFASQAAIAIGNAQLFEAERFARERAEVLREAARVISATLSLDQIIETVLGQLARILTYDSGSVILTEEGRLHVQAGHGYENFTEHVQLSEIDFDASAQSVWYVVKEGKPLMIPDVRVDQRWSPTSVSEHIRSWLGVPLQVRDQSIGLISLDRVAVGGFSEDEITLVQTFAAHTAAAIENARLFETAERRAHELETLRQVSLSLTYSLEPSAVLNAVLQGVFQILPHVWDAHLFIYRKDQLVFGAALWADAVQGKPFSNPRPEGLTHTVARLGEIIVVPDMRDHPLFNDLPALEGWAGAIIGLPLKIGDRIVGVLNIAFEEPRTFPQAEMRLLRLLGDQAALAIENARLFEQTIAERRHIALLYDVGRAVASSLTIRSILELAIQPTCQALGSGVGAVWLYENEQNGLMMRALYHEGIVDLSSESYRDHLWLEMGEGLAGWAAETHQAVRCPNVNAEPRWVDVPGLQENIQSVIVAPILEGEKLIGIMAVAHAEEDAFSEDQLDLFQAICQQVGLALINAQRYQDVDRLVNMLAAEQYRLESLIEMLPLGVFLLDQQRQILVTNSLGREFLAMLSPEEKTGTLTRVGPYSLAELTALHAEPLPVEITLPGPPRQVFELQARMIGGESLQWVLTIRDVTQEREIQERVQIQERLATVGQLAAGIAHDFNNIMAAIVVYADLLLMDPALSKTSQERLTIIQQQVQRASSLIRQILDFSRRSVMEQSNLTLIPFLKEIRKLLDRTLPENVDIELQYSDEDFVISADPTRLQQVFMNLAVNARDAMPKGGALRFKVDSFHLKSLENAPASDMPLGDWVRITIADTGVGIAPENMSHIFEPFFTTKPVGQGTGLGLAQVYGIIKQHDGFIIPHSQPGEGTAFEIYMPSLAAPGQSKSQVESRVGLSGEGQTILLVEDDLATRTALQTLLKAYGFRVLTAPNGVEALSILEYENSRVVLVISDIVMPKMGGMEMYNHIRQRWPTIKVLFMTGHPLDSANQTMLEAGQVYWLQKPFAIQEFSQTIDNLLNTI